ncbi:oligopeptide/dipeptide ABC transporter ATP-binding protein [Bradyrhizobium sp. USDA 326]|uniref:ABC transporter ATP-binding protein n=1 Tax=Bradyrhizobium sp. USDA 326 TaxID=3377726 RepID=UPI003C71E43F
MEKHVPQPAKLPLAQDAGAIGIRSTIVQRPSPSLGSGSTFSERENMRLLEVSGLSVSAGGEGKARLLEEVSFEIRRGEFFALVGESGSGKSVLCSALMGLLPSSLTSTGRIWFDGRTLAQSHRRSRAVIFQQPTQYLNPLRTIGFQIQETVEIASRTTKREARERAVDLLRSVGIHDPIGTMRKYPHEMSGGMNQRVMIALALALRPKLLIADEPTSALDVTTQKQIMDLLDRVRSDWGMAVLFVTHDLALAAERSDRIGVLYAGQLVEVGPAKLLADTALHPYTDALFSSITDISLCPTGLRALAGGVPDPTQRKEGCHFASRCSKVVSECEQTAPYLATDVDHAAACHNPR